ncbi:MAG: hypothetical protein ACQESR_24445 [Planctomycetota bacterium]
MALIARSEQTHQTGMLCAKKVRVGSDSIWKLVTTMLGLIRLAAQGHVVYNDDTTNKILEFMGKRARKAACQGAVVQELARGMDALERPSHAGTYARQPAMPGATHPLDARRWRRGTEQATVNAHAGRHQPARPPRPSQTAVTFHVAAISA